MKRWPTKPLGEVCEFVRGISFKPKDLVESGSPDSLACFRTKNVQAALEADDLLYVPRSFVKTDRQIVREGDALISTANSNNLVGKCCYVPHLDYTATIGGFIAAIRPDPTQIQPRFLYHWLVSPQIQIRLRGLARQTTNISNLPLTDVAKELTPVPPLAEQERVVKLLDEADELRQLRAQADRRTAQLIPALFHEMFRQSKYEEKTIGQFLNEGWLTLHKDGNHGSLYPRASDFGSEGAPFLSATCVTDEGTIDHSKVKRLAAEKAKQLRHGWIERGDVLLAHNASVGAVGFYEGDYERAIIGTSLTTFRANPERIDPRYLWSALRDVFFQRQIERIMKQALRNQVPITAQRELLLRVPPLPLQKEFAARVSEIRSLEAAQAASCQRLENLFQSLLHRAFNGEL